MGCVELFGPPGRGPEGPRDAYSESRGPLGPLQGPGGSTRLANSDVWTLRSPPPAGGRQSRMVLPEGSRVPTLLIDIQRTEGRAVKPAQSATKGTDPFLAGLTAPPRRALRAQHGAKRRPAP